jgi:hypothetical protein
MTKNRSRSSLVMSKKEEKKVMANFYTQPLQDFGETNTPASLRIDWELGFRKVRRQDQ